jgi:hypothetical protein
MGKQNMHKEFMLRNFLKRGQRESKVKMDLRETDCVRPRGKGN